MLVAMLLEDKKACCSDNLQFTRTLFKHMYPPYMDIDRPKAISGYNRFKKYYTEQHINIKTRVLMILPLYKINNSLNGCTMRAVYNNI